MPAMRFRFCPLCGAKLIRRKIPYHEEAKRLGCSRCQFVLYRNPVPTASAIITDGHRVLLAKRSIDPKKGYWDVPGGFLEEWEHPERGVVREVREELSLTVVPTKLLGIFMDTYFFAGDRISTLNFYYLVRVVRGRIRPASDVSEARWFSKKNLPRVLAFRSNTAALRAWKRMT